MLAGQCQHPHGQLWPWQSFALARQLWKNQCSA
jgi:hypothetical protein